MYATKIKMKFGKYNSESLLEIDEIYITGCSSPDYYKKDVVHDYLKENPGSIQVGIYPYPNLLPAISVNKEKYVRSSPDPYKHDDLLDLPRE